MSYHCIREYAHSGWRGFCFCSCVIIKRLSSNGGNLMHSTVVLLHVCVDSQSSSHGGFESSKRRWLDFVGFAKTFHVVKLPSVLKTRGGESQVFNPQWGSFWECWECQIWEFDKMNVGLKEAIYAYSERRLMWHLQRSVVGTEEAFWMRGERLRKPKEVQS